MDSTTSYTLSIWQTNFPGGADLLSGHKQEVQWTMICLIFGIYVRFMPGVQLQVKLLWGTTISLLNKTIVNIHQGTIFVRRYGPTMQEKLSSCCFHKTDNWNYSVFVHVKLVNLKVAIVMDIKSVSYKYPRMSPSGDEKNLCDVTGWSNADDLAKIYTLIKIPCISRIPCIIIIPRISDYHTYQNVRIYQNTPIEIRSSMISKTRYLLNQTHQKYELL